MDFIEATDLLTACPSHADVASAAGVSVQTVRQARLAHGNANKRPPPDRWEATIAKLARERAAELQRLADALEAR